MAAARTLEELHHPALIRTVSREIETEPSIGPLQPRENMQPIDVSRYVPTDGFFGAPYIDEDVELDAPVPLRRIHGRFEGTDTRSRFRYYRGMARSALDH
jgi:hypothetical protein